jgi:uncharacterized protein
LDLIALPDNAPPLVRGYGNGGFRIGATRFESAVLVTPQGVAALDLTGLDSLNGSLAAGIAALDPRPDVLLMGTDTDMKSPPPAFTEALRQAGIALEHMATGPACRTFNVLMLDGRGIAAVLLPVP